MLILLTGLPGTGKSTIANLLAEKTGGLVINSDTLRKELFPVKRTYSSIETGIVIQETERLVREALLENKTVILDALFTKQDARDKYQKLAQELKVSFKVILVGAPESLIKERLDERSLVNDSSEATFEIYLDRKKHFEAVNGEHLTITNEGSLEDLRTKVDGLKV